MKRAISLAVLLVALTAQVASAQVDRFQATGKVTFLRVHAVGTGYGPPTDFIDVEVVIQIDSQPGKSFGFTLRNDGSRVAHQGMLDVLRDAFRTNTTVTVDFDLQRTQPPRNNGILIRVALRK